MLPFSHTPLFRLFQKRHIKDIQRFLEMKLFQKDRFKHKLNSLNSRNWNISYKSDISQV